MCRRAAVVDEGRGVFTLRICRALRGGRVPGKSLTRVLVGPAFSHEPTGRVQPAIVSDHHRAPVWKQYRAPWLPSWRAEMRERVLRERVFGLSAVWPSGSGRMASGIWPCGLWTLAVWRFLILHARLRTPGPG